MSIKVRQLDSIDMNISLSQWFSFLIFNSRLSSDRLHQEWSIVKDRRWVSRLTNLSHLFLRNSALTGQRTCEVVFEFHCGSGWFKVYWRVWSSTALTPTVEVRCFTIYVVIQAFYRMLNKIRSFRFLISMLEARLPKS